MCSHIRVTGTRSFESLAAWSRQPRLFLPRWFGYSDESANCMNCANLSQSTGLAEFPLTPALPPEERG